MWVGTIQFIGAALPAPPPPAPHLDWDIYVLLASDTSIPGSGAFVFWHEHQSMVLKSLDMNWIILQASLLSRLLTL